MPLPTPTPRIAILGAGPAGLTLASLLTRNSIPYTIYDLRPYPSSTSPTSPLVPSGSLDLHADSGLLALEHCGLLPQFQALKAGASEETFVTDKNGDVKWRDDGMGGGRPEIARNDLTNLLLSSIPGEKIKWEHKLLSIEPSKSQNSNWTLHFSHKNKELEEDFDFVVGADGAWSRTRSLLTETKPHFSGVHCVTLTIPNITSQHPDLAAMIGGGTFSASSAKKSIIAQRGSLDSARVYLMLSSSPSEDYLETSGLAALTSSPSDLKTRLLSDSELFGEWGEGIKSLIAAGCGSSFEVSANPLFMFPVGFTWPHTPGATVIGDAAHLMTPFAGEGVNAAMKDALELSQALVSALKSASEDLDDKVKEFEEVMWERAAEIAAETWGNLETIFADDAPMGFVRMMESHGPPPEE